MVSMMVALVVSRPSTMGQTLFSGQGRDHSMGRCISASRTRLGMQMKEQAERNQGQKRRFLKALHSHSPSPGFSFEPMYAEAEGITTKVRLDWCLRFQQ